MFVLRVMAVKVWLCWDVMWAAESTNEPAGERTASALWFHLIYPAGRTETGTSTRVWTHTKTQHTGTYRNMHTVRTCAAKTCLQLKRLRRHTKHPASAQKHQSERCVIQKLERVYSLKQFEPLHLQMITNTHSKAPAFTQQHLGQDIVQ